jgi:NADH dehydrogenase
VKIAVTGATGFVGGYVVNALLRRGHEVRVLARSPDSARSKFLRPVPVAVGDILDASSLAAALPGCDAVVHLVGIIHEAGGHSFDEIHRHGTALVVAAAERAGARRYLHISAMGSSPESPSAYGRSKAAAEGVVGRSHLDWTIFRPSIIFGPGDGFVNQLAGIARSVPFVFPVIGSGKTMFMPVSVRDVARCFAQALEKPETIRQTYEVGGPEVFTFEEIAREIASALGKPGKRIVHVPVGLARFAASFAERLTAPPLTRDQLASLSVDNVADTAGARVAFGDTWAGFRAGIREYVHPRGRHDPMIGI